jgi:hypothetical protein
MRLAQALSLCLALQLQACTEAQDLGDHSQGDGDGDGESDQPSSGDSDGDTENNGHDQNSDGPFDGNGDDAVIMQHGSFEAFTPHSLAYYRLNSDLGLGLVSEAGALGCALGGDESGSPGGEASLVLVKLPTSANADVCPAGNYAIRNDPDSCSDLSFFGLPARCGVFRHWNDDAEMSAEVLATGGAIAITPSGDHCKVELVVTFPGGHKVEQTFDLTFGTGDTSNSDYCFH